MVKKSVDAAGNVISQFFEDNDGDGNPDSDEPVFTLPRDDTSTVSPVLSGEIILISPDGPVFMYSEDVNSSDFDSLCSVVSEKWAEKNGALDKPFTNYTVSEGLLLIIAIAAVVSLLSKLFKRRKF